MIETKMERLLALTIIGLLFVTMFLIDFEMALNISVSLLILYFIYSIFGDFYRLIDWILEGK